MLSGAATPYWRERLITQGTTPAQATVTLPPGHEWLIEAREHDNDAVLEVRDSAANRLAQADHPERRTGTRRAIIAPPPATPLTLRVAGKEHDAISGTVDILVFDLAAWTKNPTCIQAYRALAAADTYYAVGQEISLGHASIQPPRSEAPSAARPNARPSEAPSASRSEPRPEVPSKIPSARAAYTRAAEEYLTAEQLLDSPADATLRGEIALALAGIHYFDLQEWRDSADWARAAEKLLERRDPYRQARAKALAAAAWMEMATQSEPRSPAAGSRAPGPGTANSSTASPATPGADSNPKTLLSNARRVLRELSTFHLHRDERYDAALQINNQGLAYLYEGRFDECIATAGLANRMFAKLREAPRQGLAWQNRALCDWGLGHLPQALDAFNRALKDLGPQPYPNLYLLTLNNTALMHYALGHFDESLRLHDRALALAIHSQNRRAEAQSLYGVGVTYYALGDRTLAREFLERALAIRTAAFDRRGRTATLRSLATVYTDLGDYRQAIAFDREALALATTLTSHPLGRIQLAVHTALAGDAQEALDLLADLIRPATEPDPLYRARARLARAAIERSAGAYVAALRDLRIALPVFQRAGSVTDAFSADLERARVLGLAGSQAAALFAVDRALERSDAIRTQTANPEFRAQLQLPLRAAYDLKLDMLWEKFERAQQAGNLRDAARIAALAFYSADAARARSFADIAAQRYSPAIRGDLAGDFARRERLYQSLAGLRFALDSRLDQSGSTDPRAKALAGQIAGMQREVDTLNTAIAARTAAAGPTTRAPTSAGTTVPADVAIIAYWLGSESAYAWAVTPTGIHWARLTSPTTLAAAARAFHDSLTRLTDIPREQRLATASTLYREIIHPVAEWITPYTRWFFIPDAALDYVPFAALRGDSRDEPRDGESPYIVMAHDIALAPAAWMLVAPRGQSRDPPAPRSPSAGILLVSDPVYERSDPRLALQPATILPKPVSRSATAPADAAIPFDRPYRRIPGTAREAAAIQALFPPAQVESLAGVEATRERLLQLDWSRYRFIHIATHGYLDAHMPQLSALVLSTYDQHGERIESSLRSADLSTLTLGADMAVFTGCETALGKEVLSEGMVGIAYATLARGAGAVVSSLWQVPDEIGAPFMTELYRHLVSDSMSPTAALSASMRSVLRRNPSADPALWAAFQVSVLRM